MGAKHHPVVLQWSSNAERPLEATAADIQYHEVRVPRAARAEARAAALHELALHRDRLRAARVAHGALQFATLLRCACILSCVGRRMDGSWERLQGLSRRTPLALSRISTIVACGQTARRGLLCSAYKTTLTAPTHASTHVIMEPCERPRAQ